MTIFDSWIERQEEKDGNRVLHTCTEKPDGRANVSASLKDVMRSHYNDLSVIADDIKNLGYDMASAILKERLVPIRRLRYKDGREMALHGDDFIGIRHEHSGALYRSVFLTNDIYNNFAFFR